MDSFRWLASLGLALSLQAGATSVVPLYLDEMIDLSSTAFEATCVDNRSEVDSATQLVVTYTTFSVGDVLKGKVGRTYVIKQVGGEVPDGPRHDVRGIPTFAPGESYVVFMAGVSSAGFSSPIGLGQGRFTIISEGSNRKVANGRDFRDMAARIGASVPARAKARIEQDADPVRDMDLDEFKQLVRARVAAAR